MTSDHNFVLSGQDGVLVGHMSFQVKKLFAAPQMGSILLFSWFFLSNNLSSLTFHYFLAIWGNPATCGNISLFDDRQGSKKGTGFQPALDTSRFWLRWASLSLLLQYRIFSVIRCTVFSRKICFFLGSFCQNGGAPYGRIFSCKKI